MIMIEYLVEGFRWTLERPYMAGIQATHDRVDSAHGPCTTYLAAEVVAPDKQIQSVFIDLRRVLAAFWRHLPLSIFSSSSLSFSHHTRCSYRTWHKCSLWPSLVNSCWKYIFIVTPRPSEVIHIFESALHTHSRAMESHLTLSY